MPLRGRLGVPVLPVILLLVIAAPQPATAGAAPAVKFARAKGELATFAHMTCAPGCKSRVYGCKRRSARRVECHARTEKVSRGVVEPEHEFAIERTTCTWIGYATPSRQPGAGYQLDVEEYLCVTHREFPRRPDQIARIAS